MSSFSMRRQAILALFSVFAVIQPSLGTLLRSSQYCIDGCSTALGAATFTSPSGTVVDYYENKCANTLSITSLYYCGAIYCSHEHIISGLIFQNETCKSYAISGATLPDFDSFTGSTTSEELAKVIRISLSNVSTDPYDHPVVPSIDLFDTGYATTSAFSGNINYSWDYSYAMYGFWGLVLLIGMINRLVEFWIDRSYENTKVNSNDTTRSSVSSRLHLWFRRRMVLPAVFGHRCQEPTGWCTLPPRLESVLLGLFILLNFIFCFPGYKVFLPNLYYSEERLQLARYVSDRTGILSIANLPILWLFSSRNDPFLWLTGWSFATFNRFHRWVARIATVEAIVHSIGYSVFSYWTGGGDYTTEWKERYWWCGGIATIIMSLMLVASVYPLRQYYYDLFLLIHIAFAVVFLVTMYFHVLIFKGDYNGFIWPCVAIWSLDRVLRIGRILYLSVIPRLRGIRALAAYDGKTDLLRLDVTKFFADKPPTPGTFYYMYEGAAIRGYENHPFTLCTWEDSHDDHASSVESAGDQITSDGKPSGQVLVSSPTETSKIRHTLLIRPYDGFTGRLREKLTASKETNTCQVAITLEGPYCEPINLQRHTDVLIIAGGSGITAAISQAYALLSKQNMVSLRIVWAVKRLELADDICNTELRTALESDLVTVDVFLTSVKTLNESTFASRNYTVHTGRPDIDDEIAASRAQSSGSLGVVCCGVPKMADACRSSVVRALGKSGVNVGFYNETSGW